MEEKTFFVRWKRWEDVGAQDCLDRLVYHDSLLTKAEIAALFNNSWVEEVSFGYYSSQVLIRVGPNWKRPEHKGMRVWRSYDAALLTCICGVDHDCRSTGCDEECESCNGPHL